MGWLLAVAGTVAVYLLLRIAAWRRACLSAPALRLFRRLLPPLSATEREAMAAGDVWWDGELFSGAPDWHKLHHFPKPQLSGEEQHFLDEVVDPLLARLSDFTMVNQERALPAEVWTYLSQHGFFGLIIPREYGGLGFSSYANSTIVARIASRSLNVAVTVMVPNSLGPAELLLHYGSAAQKLYWLPRLARGEEYPCFALTGPEVGSDASAIPDLGVIAKGLWQGEERVGIRLTWQKRYITLAPCATVLGLAFRLVDPDHLLGEQSEYGITCALIPTTHPGVVIGARHLPMGQIFPNGPTEGKEVFIPLEWIIGGWAGAGKGWRMLVECLSAGRGISLPALGAACGHLALRTTSAYAYVRRQFGLPIGKFEGVQEALARIAAVTYQLEAARRLTTTGLDMGCRPGIVTAIAKYHMTELAREALSDAMDIHGGRAVQLGPSNYLAYHYICIPIAVTVEGANILTRSLMIFGQGAFRCHPFLFNELAAASLDDDEQALSHFDALLWPHLRFTLKNLALTLLSGLTLGRGESSPRDGVTAGYYRQLTRMSRALALSSDLVMLLLGGELKRKEMLSARLGDLFSQLYLASAVLKYYEEEGSPESDLPLLEYNLRHALWLMGTALQGVCDNLAKYGVGRLLKFLIFPFGMPYQPVRDATVTAICQQMLQRSEVRERITGLCFWQENEQDPVGRVELAFAAMLATQPLEQRLLQAQKQGLMEAKQTFAQRLQQAEALGLLSSQEVAMLQEAERLRILALQVDSFAPGELEGMGCHSPRE
ncbi:MAG: acyl-CoA dehydrogenase [Aeromonadaceae bacterium]